MRLLIVGSYLLLMVFLPQLGARNYIVHKDIRYDRGAAPQKIAFLFLTVDNIYHESFWQQFLNGHEDQYSLYIHAKNSITSPFFSPHVIRAKVRTNWYHTMQAQVALLRVALQDPHNDKFIFVSESCVPIQPFSYFFTTLINQDASIMRFWPNDRSAPKRSLAKLPQPYRYANQQWIILNRKHATLMAYDQKYLTLIAEYDCDNEHYPSSFLALSNKLSEVKNQLSTLVDWERAEEGAHPYIFKNFIENPQDLEIIQQAHDDGLFFVRKVAASCDTTPLLPCIINRNA